jgi:omega-hydroxy-beta-dihydromenaquinone-9 sulfotransferase
VKEIPEMNIGSTPEVEVSTSADGVASAPILFIVGPSRSGTSLLCNIFGKHSQVVGMNELHLLGDMCSASTLNQTIDESTALTMLARLKARQLRTIWNDQIEPADMEFARRLLSSDGMSLTPASVFRRFAANVAAEQGKRMVVEQTPRNVMYLSQILEAFPEAKVVAMIRDPRAVLNSQRSRWQMRFLGAPNVPFTEALRVFVNYHAITMSKLWLKAVGMAEQFSSHPRVHLVTYEDLISTPQLTLEGLCNFLNIAFEEKMLTVGRIGSSSHRNDDQNAGISNKSVDTWQKDLPRGDREICEYLTGTVAARYGYACPSATLLSLSSLSHMARFPLHVVGMLVANPFRVWIMTKAFFAGR